MILVSVQSLDAASGNASHNGTAVVHFYNLNEAKLFAENESLRYPGSDLNTEALCKVYNDGEIVQVWQSGTDITG